MKIEERMDRNSMEDQIEIGNIIESSLKGSFGEVMKAMIEGLKSEFLMNSDAVKVLPADRILGRLEGLSRLQDRLDYAVMIARELKEDIKDEKRV